MSFYILSLFLRFSYLHYRVIHPVTIPIFDVFSIHNFNFIPSVTLLCLKPFHMKHTFKSLKTRRSIHLVVLLRLVMNGLDWKAPTDFRLAGISRCILAPPSPKQWNVTNYTEDVDLCGWRNCLLVDVESLHDIASLPQELAVVLIFIDSNGENGM